MTTDNQHAQQQLRELIGEIRFAMFTSMGSDGHLRSRPMTTQNASSDDQDTGHRLWFFMSRTSDTAVEIATNPHVNVSYAHPGKDAYVSVSGQAQVVEDRDIKQQLWSKMNEAWFPKGIDDPDLALVCVDIDGAEYWNVEESKLVQVAKMVKAAMTDTRPTDMGEHARVKP